MTGHYAFATVWSAVRRLVRFAALFAPVWAAASGTPFMSGEVRAFDDVRAGIEAERSGPDEPAVGEPALVRGQDPSEDFISGLRSVLKSRGSSYPMDPGVRGFRRNAETNNVSGSFHGTEKNLNRSMRSITNSVRSMNTSINRIRTYRRRF
ncbi:MAG: hypothetical protein V1792_27400 [Pseudomonadota bacterium]